MPALLPDLLPDLAALLWPTECVSCGAADRDCCDACLAELRVHGDVLSGSIDRWPVYAAGTYTGPLRAVLIACKHHGQTGFARELGEQLRGPLRVALHLCQRTAPGRAMPLLVPAPSRPARVRQRGFQHVETMIAAAVRGARLDGVPLPEARQVRALRALPGRVGQVGLTPTQRLHNARQVAVRRGATHRIRGRDVVLVDDIVTTGATSLAACEALQHAGARVVAVASVCTVESRIGSGKQVFNNHRDTRGIV